MGQICRHPRLAQRRRHRARHRDFARMRTKYTAHPSASLLGTDKCSRRNILAQYYLLGRKTFDKLK